MKSKLDLPSGKRKSHGKSYINGFVFIICKWWVFHCCSRAIPMGSAGPQNPIANLSAHEATKFPMVFGPKKKRKIHRRIYPARKDQMAGSDATFKMFRISSLPVKFSHFWVFIYVSLLFFMSIILLRCDVLPELYRGPKKLFAKKGPPSIPMKNISIHFMYI